MSPLPSDCCGSCVGFHGRAWCGLLLTDGVPDVGDACPNPDSCGCLRVSSGSAGSPATGAKPEGAECPSRMGHTLGHRPSCRVLSPLLCCPYPWETPHSYCLENPRACRFRGPTNLIVLSGHLRMTRLIQTPGKLDVPQKCL